MSPDSTSLFTKLVLLAVVALAGWALIRFVKLEARPEPSQTMRYLSPLLAVVLKPGTSLTRDELLAFYEGKIPRWQVPNDVIFLPELPHTATGKIQKLKLREAFRNHQWSEL